MNRAWADPRQSSGPLRHTQRLYRRCLTVSHSLCLTISHSLCLTISHSLGITSYSLSLALISLTHSLCLSMSHCASIPHHLSLCLIMSHLLSLCLTRSDCASLSLTRSHCASLSLIAISYSLSMSELRLLQHRPSGQSDDVQLEFCLFQVTLLAACCCLSCCCLVAAASSEFLGLPLLQPPCLLLLLLLLSAPTAFLHVRLPTRVPRTTPYLHVLPLFAPPFTISVTACVTVSCFHFLTHDWLLATVASQTCTDTGFLLL